VKIVVAYCQLHPKTVAAVWDAVSEREEIVWGDTSGSDMAYYELLTRCWAEGETFVVLEQDKIPVPGALSELYNCSEPWCSFPVPMANTGTPCGFVSLSATKFGEVLIQGAPDLMERVAKLDMGYGPKHWNRLDMSMNMECARALGRMRRLPHVHWHADGMIGHEHIQLGVSA
jgi:hypothetical protein